MTATRVVNVKQEACDVYIGRPHPRFPQGSCWGNPFHLGADGTRAQVIAKYRTWLLQQPALLARLDELRGKRLGCWCAPAACHGDVLRELVAGCDEPA